MIIHNIVSSSESLKVLFRVKVEIWELFFTYLSSTSEVIDLEVWTLEGPGGAGALRFLFDLLVMPVTVLIVGEVGLEGVAQPDPELILSPALCK